MQSYDATPSQMAQSNDKINEKLHKRRKDVPQGSPLIPILCTTITLQRLKRRGYVSFTELHLKRNSFLGACPIFFGKRRVLDPTLGVEKGALHHFLAEPSTRLANVIHLQKS